MAVVFAHPNVKGDDKLFITFSENTVDCSHPLEGCRIGLNAQDGVVDSFGHVFNPSKGEQGIHQGLYIADGYVIPTALSVILH